MEIRALSFKQPYADLIAHDGKIETRTWNTSYRGPVLICSSKAYYTVRQVLDISGFDNWIRMRDYYPWTIVRHRLGQALAVGELVDCRPMVPEDEARTFVAYKPGLYCHVYENVRAIQSFEWRGCQGWKKLTEEDKAKIKYR